MCGVVKPSGCPGPMWRQRPTPLQPVPESRGTFSSPAEPPGGEPSFAYLPSPPYPSHPFPPGLSHPTASPHGPQTKSRSLPFTPLRGQGEKPPVRAWSPFLRPGVQPGPKAIPLRPKLCTPIPLHMTPVPCLCGAGALREHLPRSAARCPLPGGISPQGSPPPPPPATCPPLPSPAGLGRGGAVSRGPAPLQASASAGHRAQGRGWPPHEGPRSPVGGAHCTDLAVWRPGDGSPSRGMGQHVPVSARGPKLDLKPRESLQRHITGASRMGARRGAQPMDEGMGQLNHQGPSWPGGWG